MRHFGQKIGNDTGGGGPSIPVATSFTRCFDLPIGNTTATTDAVIINVALASNGSTATAQDLPGVNAAPSLCINGVRHTNNSWTGNGYASDNGNDKWFEVDFNATRVISGINVFFLSDAVNYNTDPSTSDTGTNYRSTDFELLYWNGSTWSTITTVTGNNNIRRDFTFSPVTTNKIRLHQTTAGSDTRLFFVEIEAWGY